MATQAGILAWRIPWTEVIQSMESQRVRHNGATNYLLLSISIHSFILHSYLLKPSYPQGREGARCGRRQHLGWPGTLSCEEHTNCILQGKQERVCKC